MQQFFRSEIPVSPIEPLLDKVDAADNAPLHTLADAPPTIEHFLDEEDILRECRAGNKRLISYLCRPDNVRALVSHCVDVPSQQLRPEETAVGAEPLNARVDSNSDQERKKQYKFPYVASELLSTDVRALCDVLVGDDEVMDSFFACLDENAPGELNPLVATYFSKVIVSLLKTRNAQTIAQMRRRKEAVINGFLKHLALGPIAELIVRVLDGPDVDRSYANTIVAPSQAALDLLAEANILSGLADCFVEASKAPCAPSADADPSTHDAESTAQRRQREESMANATSTIHGLARRVLQLPALGVPVPNLLSPYHAPEVVARLLDAGLTASEAQCASVAPDQKSAAEEAPPPAFGTAPVRRVGSNSALLHSLGLAASLMTTESNIWHEEETMMGSDPDGQSGIIGQDYEGPFEHEPEEYSVEDGAERPAEAKAGEDGSASETVEKEEEKEEAREEGEADSASRPDPAKEASTIAYTSPDSLLDGKQNGDCIIGTAGLEKELSSRFQRLSEMFSFEDGDGEALQPLGSLRLKLAEFFVACMKKASPETVNRIVDLGVPKKLLELFLKYEWSSILHGVVTSSVVFSLDDDTSGQPSRKAWLDAGILPWLMKAWQANSGREGEEDQRKRAGYMGHLIRIGTALRSFLDERSDEECLEILGEDLYNEFNCFFREELAPAHKLEVTPLCHDQLHQGGPGVDDEDAEEATPMFDMGVGQVIQGLSQGDSNAAIDRFAKFLLSKSSVDVSDDVEEEEVETVEVGDFSNFDEAEEDMQRTSYTTDMGSQTRAPDIDYDLPESMRDSAQRQAKEDRETAPLRRAQATSNNNSASAPLDDITALPNGVEEGEVVDDGSYAAFTGSVQPATGSNRQAEELLAANFRDKVQISEGLASQYDAGPTGMAQDIPTPSLEVDAAVTEIDEPQPVTPSTPTPVSKVAASSRPAFFQDDADSSDDDSGEWIPYDESDLSMEASTKSKTAVNDDSGTR